MASSAAAVPSEPQVSAPVASSAAAAPISSSSSGAAATPLPVLLALPLTDFDTTEVSVPWKLLRDAGVPVVFATESGATGATDPKLLTGVLWTNDSMAAGAEAKDFYQQMIATHEFQHPITFADFERDADKYSALVLPGGHAPGMRVGFLESASLQAAVRAFWRLQRPVAAICHGVLVLARTKAETEGGAKPPAAASSAETNATPAAAGAPPTTGDGQQSVLFGKRVMTLPKWLERMAYFASAWKLGRYYRTYDTYLEDEVIASLAREEDYHRGAKPFFGLAPPAKGSRNDDTGAEVCVDGNLISARWPGDAYLFAKTLVAKIQQQ